MGTQCDKYVDYTPPKQSFAEKVNLSLVKSYIILMTQYGYPLIPQVKLFLTQ